MKRVNNRGVVLLEMLIVSIFVMAIFVFIYRNTIPMMGQYEKLSTFDDVDSVYAVNLIKNMVVSNIPAKYIDENLLANSSYADISNCNDSQLYTDSDYCIKLKQSLNIEDNDLIYITRYYSSDLDSFREEINKKEKDYLFAGGELGKFRDYLKTVANNEAFYNPNSNNNKIIGLYRIFISRTVSMIDGTSIKKYANIGIYKNNY